MGIQWHDVTIPMQNGMAVWPGDPAFEFKAKARMANGDECNISHISLGVHTGTHVDAPWHFEDDGKRTDEVDTSLFFGPALLIDVHDVPIITADLLGTGPFPPRVLLKTRNSDFPPDGPFREDYTALDEEAAQRLVENHVRMIGVDYLSVGPYKQPGQATHHRLLQKDVLIVEGLRLKGFTGGMYEFTVLPLALAGADGSPCRAFLGIEEQGI